MQSCSKMEIGGKLQQLCLMWYNNNSGAAGKEEDYLPSQTNLNLHAKQSQAIQICCNIARWRGTRLKPAVPGQTPGVHSPAREAGARLSPTGSFAEGSPEPGAGVSFAPGPQEQRRSQEEKCAPQLHFPPSSSSGAHCLPPHSCCARSCSASASGLWGQQEAFATLQDEWPEAMS